MANTPSPNPHAVQDYLDTLDDEPTLQDTLVLIDIMRRISGHEPVLWNVGTMGFDAYHYKYDSGHEGDCHVIGFYPRKGKLTFYLMDGTSHYPELLTKLGKYTASKSCLYIKRLSDIELPVLEELIRRSYEHVKHLYPAQ